MYSIKFIKHVLKKEFLYKWTTAKKMNTILKLKNAKWVIYSILRRQIMKTYEGKLISKNLKFGIIVGRFNEFIGSKLLSGALDALKRHGANEEDIVCGHRCFSV